MPEPPRLIAPPSPPRAARRGWLLARRRPPCPHCGRRSVRLPAPPAGGLLLASDALEHRCRDCGGAVRYARTAAGREYWVAADRPAGPVEGGAEG